MLFTFPAETESGQMDFGNFLLAKPGSAAVRLLWVQAPKGPWPLRPPYSLPLPRRASSQSPEPDVTYTGGPGATGRGHHQRLWLLTVFLHPGLISFL